MAGRMDPPHDRVVLTVDERLSIAGLEEQLARDACRGDASHGGESRSARPRYRRLAVCLRWIRLGPWLVPTGLLVMVALMSSSVVGSAVGALLAAVGLAASVRPIERWGARKVRGRRRRRL
jgi:hypothetical protein